MTDWKSFLAQVKERASKATLGPWDDDAGNCIVTGYPVETPFGPMAEQLGQFPLGPVGRANSEFVSHAITDIPLLISRIETLEEALEVYSKMECDADGCIYVDNVVTHEQQVSAIARQALNASVGER